MRRSSHQCRQVSHVRQLPTDPYAAFTRRPDRPRLWPAWSNAHPSATADCAPLRGAFAAGADPPLIVLSALAALPARQYDEHPWRYPARSAARCHSERCCGMPASRARTSVSRYRRCPPSVRMEVSFPALAHRVTVFGSTRNMVATSAGVSRGSASGVRADMLTASPPGPVLRSCVCSVPGSLREPAVDVPYGLLRPYCHHQR